MAHKALSTNAIALGRKLDYLPIEDRYLSAAPSPKYKFNIIGTGIMGQEHIRVTLLEGRATIHGIYDPNPSSRTAAQTTFSQYAAQYGSPNTSGPNTSGKGAKAQQPLVEYETLAQACQDPAIDGIIICTPNHTHANVLEVAMSAQKHILLEKPMATTLKDAYHIHQLAKNYQPIMQIGLQYRYKPIYVEAIHEALQRQSLGTIKTLSIMEHRPPFLDKVNQWNKFAKSSGGTLVEKCCHYFDLFNLFAQSRPETVFATGNMAVNFREFQYRGESANVIDHAAVIVNYANGVCAHFNFNMFSPLFHEELVICGDKGRLKASERETFLSGHPPETQLEVFCADQAPSRTGTPRYTDQIAQSGHGGATYYEHVMFVDNIEKKPTNTASTEEGFWSVVVAAAAQAAIEDSKLIDVGKFMAAHDLDI